MIRLDALAVNDLVARSVILGCGQAQRGALLAIDRQNLLHRALAEGFFADDLGTIVVLEAASDNLRGAGAEAVHQHHHRQLGPGVAAGRLVLGVLALAASLGSDDWLSLSEELFANLDRLVKQATRIVAQVEHEALHVLQLEFAQRLLEITRGCLTKLRQAHVAYLVFVDDELALVVDVLNSGDLDQRPLEGDLNVLPGGRSEERHFDFRTRLAPKLVHRLRHGNIAGVFALNLHDAVTRHDARLIGWRVLHRRQHCEVAILNVDVHADTAEPALGVVLEVRVLGRRHELAMGIEHAKHAPQRTVHKILVRQLAAINVVAPDALEHVDEQVEIGVRIVGR